MGRGAETGARHDGDAALGVLVVPLHRQQHGPHGAIDIVGVGDVHRDPHGGRVGDERMPGVIGLDDHRRADGLLPQVLVQNTPLHPVHQPVAEEPDDGGVDAAIHQAERVGGADHAVEHRQLLEVARDGLDVGQPLEVSSPGDDHLDLRIHQDQPECRHSPAARFGRIAQVHVAWAMSVPSASFTGLAVRPSPGAGRGRTSRTRSRVDLPEVRIAANEARRLDLQHASVADAE